MSWPAIPTLSGKHVTLRPLVRADREALLAAFAQGFELTMATMAPGPATIDGWLDQIDADTAHGRAQVFTVLDAGGQVVGTTRYLRMNEKHRRVEIGGTLYAPAVRRTGLNTQAKRLLLGHAFEGLEVGCVQIRTDVFNLASRRAIERIGARLDGILRGHMVVGDGEGGTRPRDTAVYSILVSEWKAIKRHLDGLIAAYD
ncbi:GNAT family N-acetyltransferase [Novosphingobium terrae]|uniref:GNAT family N-acetyltransferase n=1 Tax=Novosphingobium terrae TaxID=2726189 RepID=UPI001F13AD7D|nr:GNAT family protein [Novosphingobium terrae]